MSSRRTFLKGALVGGAVALWPAWLRRAFADPPEACAPEPEERRLAALGAGFRRAVRVGKPLLVLVIPSEDLDKRLRGELWGGFLNYGASEALAALSLAEVVCAEMPDLRRMIPAARALDGAPLFVLIETAARPAEASAFSLERDDAPAARFESELEDGAVERRIAEVGALLLRALVGDTLERRAKESAGRLSTERLSALRGDSPSLDAIDLGAAVFLAESLDPADRARRIDRLADATRARLVKVPVPGSRWARASVCGLDRVEGEGELEGVGFACGMGHLPKKSERFLYFYARTPVEEWRERRAKLERERPPEE
jgi:hypothetical protein